MNKLLIKNLSFSYENGTTALKNISLEINLNKKTVLLGANGSGKSTLLYHLNGLYLPDEGGVAINNRLITKETADVIRREIGVLFDHPDNQLFSPTVETDIRFGPLNLGMHKAEIDEIVNKCLEDTQLKALANRSPTTLSLGQKKRCAIAGVLAMKPKIILMDEPFSGLDTVAIDSFCHLLNDLHDQNVSMIMTTHNVDKAFEWGEEYILLKDGCLLATGGKEILYDKNLMTEANLSLPTIAKIFKNYMPNSIEDAKKYVKTMENKNKG